MAVVLNGPAFWPLIIFIRFFSYFVVASSAAVVYDWVLTFGQEVDLVWRKHWSLVTLLYLSVRYAAIPYTVINILSSLPTVSVTDAVSRSVYLATTWMNVIVNVILGVIMIARLHAMYQRSRKMLIFLTVIFLGITIVCGVIAAMCSIYTSGEEFILSGTYACACIIEGGNPLLLNSMTWILVFVWVVLTLCLAVWVTAKHFRDLQRSSTKWTIGSWFTVLVQPHAIYVAVSCLALGYLSPKLESDHSEASQIYFGLFQTVYTLQMFVLGPRFILSIREYYAKLVANSDAGMDMTTIAFQEHVHVSTGGSV